MPKQLFSLISLASALWQLSMANPVDPTITPAAVLPRQNNADFMGYLSRTSVSISPWSAISCPPRATWSEGQTYAGCCTDTAADCYPATACLISEGQGYRIFPYRGSSTDVRVACTDDRQDAAYSICNTWSIYETFGLTNRLTHIDCGVSSINLSLYRWIPPSLTEQVITSSTSSQSGTSTSSSSGTFTSSSPGTSSTTSIAPVQTTEPDSGSKAWIAGAVAGPILGLALIGTGVWLFLRRKKKAATAHMDLSQPPAGVGGYTDAKPQYQPAQHVYLSPAQGQAYPQQGGFSPPQMSPAPQYGFHPPHNATPSPLMGAYTHDVKYEANREAEAAELGGSSTIVSGAPTVQGPSSEFATHTSQAAELNGSSFRRGHPDPTS